MLYISTASCVGPVAHVQEGLVCSSQPADLPWCRAIEGLMETLPLKKLRNFGGKLGGELEKLGCTTAGQVLGWPAVRVVLPLLLPERQLLLLVLLVLLLRL